MTVQIQQVDALGLLKKRYPFIGKKISINETSEIVIGKPNHEFSAVQLSNTTELPSEKLSPGTLKLAEKFATDSSYPLSKPSPHKLRKANYSKNLSSGYETECPLRSLSTTRCDSIDTLIPMANTEHENISFNVINTQRINNKIKDDEYLNSIVAEQAHSNHQLLENDSWSNTFVEMHAGLSDQITPYFGLKNGTENQQQKVDLAHTYVSPLAQERVECKHCSRSFVADAHKRHESKCGDVRNKPRPPPKQGQKWLDIQLH
jgi:hypothetical protein